jgi:periplasmic protein TonB
MKAAIAGLVALLLSAGAWATEVRDVVVTPCAEGTEVRADANPWRYPAQARRGREQGTVTLRLVLDDQGGAQRVSLVKGSGSSLLDRSATAAARSKSVRFCPLNGDGPVAAGVAVVNVTYSLTQTVAQL